MKARVILKGLALMLSLALLGYLFKTSDLGNSVNEAWIDARVRGHGVNGALLFLLMGGLFTAIGLPRQIIAFLGGYAFSVGLGTLLGALAALLGCMLSFAYARFFGKGLLRARLGERAGRFDRFIHDHPFSMTVLIRLLPVGSNLLTNLAAGISSIRPVAFLLRHAARLSAADAGVCAGRQRRSHRAGPETRAGHRPVPDIGRAGRLSVSSFPARPEP